MTPQNKVYQNEVPVTLGMAVPGSLQPFHGTNTALRAHQLCCAITQTGHIYREDSKCITKVFCPPKRYLKYRQYTTQVNQVKREWRLPISLGQGLTYNLSTTQRFKLQRCQLKGILYFLFSTHLVAFKPASKFCGARSIKMASLNGIIWFAYTDLPLQGLWHCCLRIMKIHLIHFEQQYNYFHQHRSALGERALKQCSRGKEKLNAVLLNQAHTKESKVSSVVCRAIFHHCWLY